jgi:predicted Zn-dependent peptidase
MTPPDTAAQAATPRGVTLQEFGTLTLENGLTILLMEKRDVPLVAFTAVIKGGAIADPEGKNGTAALLAELLRKGAGDRDAAGFAEAVASVGGELGTHAGREAIIAEGLFMSRHQDLMVDLLADLLIRPTLSGTEFGKLRERSIQQIQAMKDTELFSLTTIYGNEFLLGDHPYGRSVIGSEAGLGAVSHADVRRFFDDHVGADRTILSVVGDFDGQAMRSRLEARFASWRPAASAAPSVEAPPPRPGRQLLLIDKPDATQTYFYIGNIGVGRKFAGEPALDLVNTVFGGRFTSMLNTRLRVESGLTYGALSRLERNTAGGTVAIASFTRTDATVEAIDMALDVLDTLHREALSDAQLASAKAYVMGQFPPDLETAEDLAGLLADLRFYGLDRSEIDEYAGRIDAVTIEDARRTIEAVYPTRDNLTFVLIGNASQIREAVAKYGPVTEMPITDPRFRP